jgi:hypothetical protein
VYWLRSLFRMSICRENRALGAALDLVTVMLFMYLINGVVTYVNLLMKPKDVGGYCCFMMCTVLYICSDFYLCIVQQH